MARVVFSALISAASGKIGDVVMSKWKGIPYVRRRVIPSNPQSGLQCKQRFCLKTALTLWQSVKAWAKPPWTLSVSGYAISGYNSFMDQVMTLLAPQLSESGVGEDPIWTAPAVTVLSPYNNAYAGLIDVQAGTPGDLEMVITWTARGGVAAANKVKPYFRLDDATAWSTAAAVLESAATITIVLPTNDLQYEFALVPYNDTTDLYGVSDHQLATPAA